MLEVHTTIHNQTVEYMFTNRTNGKQLSKSCLGTGIHEENKGFKPSVIASYKRFALLTGTRI